MMATASSDGVTVLTDDMSVSVNKKSIVTGKLQKRDEERIAELQKRKEERENTAAKNESADFFLENFNHAKSEIEAGLTISHSMVKKDLTEHLDGLVLSLQQMQKFLADSSMFLAAYDVQKSNETVTRLQNSIQEKRDILIPKKKFAFKSKKKAADKPVAAVKPMPQQKDDIKVDITDCSFSDQTSKLLEKKPDETNQKDVALARLTDCTVKIYGSPSALHINNLKNCQILCGPVSGSIFIDDCTSCTFVLACQQLRVHNTKVCSFYLHVTSRAIIEDSTDVKFAPYNWSYDQLDEHYSLSGLDKNRNSWNDVDDFNWLASDTHSPNWNTLDENERIVSWDM